jgi:hypothetical protein
MLKIFECCCKSGQKKGGPEIAPQILINEIKKFTNNFQNIIITDNDFSDNSGYQKLYDLSVDHSDKILTLGGDHSLVFQLLCLVCINIKKI